MKKDAGPIGLLCFVFLHLSILKIVSTDGLVVLKENLALAVASYTTTLSYALWTIYADEDMRAILGWLKRTITILKPIIGMLMLGLIAFLAALLFMRIAYEAALALLSLK